MTVAQRRKIQSALSYCSKIFRCMMSMTAKYYTSLNKIPELCEGRFTVEKIKSKFVMTENKLQKNGKSR